MSRVGARSVRAAFPRDLGIGLLVFAIVAVLPALGLGIVSPSTSLILIYILVAIAINISYGFGGQFTVAQPLSMAAASYFAGIFTLHQNWGPWPTLPIAIAAGVAMNLLITLPAIRLRGWYLAITSFFAVLVLPDLVTTEQHWTGGSDGLAGLTTGLSDLGSIATTPTRQFEFLLVLCGLAWLVQRNISTGRWGTWLRALRDAPIAAEASGVRIIRVKLCVAIVTGVLVSVAGWLWTYVNLFVTPSAFGINLLLLLTAAVFIGGRGTLWGPVIGVVIFEGITLKVGQFNDYNQIILGVALVVIAGVYPKGLVPGVRAAVEAIRARRRPSAAEGATGSPKEEELALLAESSSSGEGEEAAKVSGVARRLPPLPSEDGSQTTPVLEAIGIRKAFGGIQVLAGAELRIRPGECVGLIGANGSGKTTFLNVVTGFVKPDEGTIAVNGHQATRFGPQRVASLGISRSFQVPQLIDELSVAANVRLGAATQDGQAVVGTILRTPGYLKLERQRRLDVQAACELLGLDPAIQAAPVDSLPLGLRRIVEIARAVVSHGSLICLDEPAAGMMGRELDLLHEALYTLTSQGYAVLLVEHNLGFVAEATHRVVEMHAGTIRDWDGVRGRVARGRQSAAQPAAHVLGTAALGGLPS